MRTDRKAPQPAANKVQAERLQLGRWRWRCILSFHSKGQLFLDDSQITPLSNIRPDPPLTSTRISAKGRLVVVNEAIHGFEWKPSHSHGTHPGPWTWPWPCRLGTTDIDWTQPLSFGATGARCPDHAPSNRTPSIVQSIIPPLVPVHLALLFAGRGRRECCTAYQSCLCWAHPWSTPALARVCLARHCTLRLDQRTWNPRDSIEVQPGVGLEFLAWRPSWDEHIVEEASIEVVTEHVEPLIPAHPPLEQQPQFIQELYDFFWLRLAQMGRVV